jgi:hypothetical protein
MSDEIADQRIERLKIIRADLAVAAGLDLDHLDAASKIRLENAVWLTLSMENLRMKVLEGEVVEVSSMERYTQALNDLLPAAHELKVVFVDSSDVCILCRKPFGDDLERSPPDKAERRRRKAKGAFKDAPPIPDNPDTPNTQPFSPVPSDAFTNEKLNEPEPQNVHALIGRINGGANRTPFDAPSSLSSRFDNRG